jgi:hypothetical protein
MMIEPEKSKTRTASCQCGTLSLVAAGEPDVINICHCAFCQRRSGSVFSCNAYFLASAIDVSGTSRSFTRVGSSGRPLRNHFCPECGTTLFWRADLRPNHMGVAVGAFNDPSFAPPSVSLWESSIYAWVGIPAGICRFTHALPSTRPTKER